MATTGWFNERISEQLRREIMWVLANEMRDPRVPSICTVTEIKLSQDCYNATVFVSVYLEKEAADEAIAVINKAAAYIQRIVAGKVSLKHFPKLFFKLDTTLGQVIRIHNLLEEVKDDLV
jgi:ribosome-binding factor A